MRAGIKKLGAAMKDITDLPNPTLADLKNTFRDLNEKISKNEKKGKETFLFVFYAGHGLQDNYCVIVCNEKKLYPLEKMLRNLATNPFCFVTAIFDCCRSKIKAEHRGGAADPDEDVEFQ